MRIRDADALTAAREQSSQEAKGLLVMIRYLKTRVTREATFRGDMSYQKEYLGMLIREKQEMYVRLLTRVLLERGRLIRIKI